MYSRFSFFMYYHFIHESLKKLNQSHRPNSPKNNNSTKTDTYIHPIPSYTQYDDDPSIIY